MYFLVGKPLDMARHRGQSGDPAALHRARASVARSLRRLIAELREHRAKDNSHGALRRFLSRL